MAEGLTDDELQTVVDAYKKVQLERSQSEVQKESPNTDRKGEANQDHIVELNVF